jgi:hypothetical protein
MRQTDDCVLVADAITRLHADAGLPWPPPASRAIVPVPLETLIRTYNLAHAEVPGLSHAAAGAYLARWGVDRPELMEDSSPLAGFLFANARGGYILVRGEDPLPRRRFTAAHELGHYLLHFLPRLEAAKDKETYLLHDDDVEMVREEESADDKSLSLADMERQANQFAAELLMPEAVCQVGCAEYGTRLRMSARCLEHYLARDLLVSATAMRWRLQSLSQAT